MQASLHVFTFKTGLLAKVAHDLRLTLHAFEVRVEARRVHASFELGSLLVDGAMTARGLDPAALSPHDKQSIEHTLQHEILQTERYPQAQFESQGALELPAERAQFRLPGALTLRGQTHALALDVTESDVRLSANVEFAPSLFGIAPYKALAGAIRLQDRVRVEIALDLAGQRARELLEASEPVLFRASAS